MATITCFEHESIPYQKIADDLDNLEKLNQRFQGGDLFQFSRTHLKATSYVGVVRAGTTTIQILPKIDRNDNHAGATKNLLQLLSYTNKLSIYEQQVSSLLGQKADWLELLTGIYASHLHRLVQQGVRRDYVTVDETLPVLRGKWMLQRQLTRRPHIQHLFDVNYDEFSVDNPLNRVFRYVTERLLLTSRIQQTRQKLRNIRDWLSDVQLVAQITSGDLNRVMFNRLNEQYRPVFNLARMFIEGYTPLLSAGDQNTFAFVFDMNRLFEDFIAGFIRKNRLSIIPETWSMSAQRTYGYLASRQIGHRTKSVFRLIPDLVFTGHDKSVKLIVDTKYKLLNESTTRLGVSQADMYQMLAYATHFNCQKIILLYPQHQDLATNEEKFTIYQQGAEITVATVNISEPLNEPETSSKLTRRFHQLFYPYALETE